MEKELGIYIHIPFCKSKCHYCNFVSYENKEEIIDSYIDAICSQILQNAEILSQRKINTIYFGGGTPSYIDSKYITKIMDVLNLFVDTNKELEVTIECNPNSITEEKLQTYKNAGINRISIGLQSIHDDILKIIGRAHKYSDFINALSLCKKTGINNISIDLIYPLPNLTTEMFADTLKQVIKLKDEYDIKHISIYNLEIHEDTRLDFLIKENYVKMVDEDQEYQMKELLEKVLEENNFIHYEISNFALKGYESKHNNIYWNQGEYLGFGVAASSFICGSRYKNIDNIDVYIQNIKYNNSPIIEQEDMDKLDLMKEFILLKLRLKYGVNIQEFKNKFNVDIYSIFRSEFTELEKLSLIETSKDAKNIFLTKRGREVANKVWEKFV